MYNYVKCKLFLYIRNIFARMSLPVAEIFFTPTPKIAFSSLEDARNYIVRNIIRKFLNRGIH